MKFNSVMRASVIAEKHEEKKRRRKAEKRAERDALREVASKEKLSDAVKESIRNVVNFDDVAARAKPTVRLGSPKKRDGSAVSVKISSRQGSQGSQGSIKKRDESVSSTKSMRVVASPVEIKDAFPTSLWADKSMGRQFLGSVSVKLPQGSRLANLKPVARKSIARSETPEDLKRKADEEKVSSTAQKRSKSGESLFSDARKQKECPHCLTTDPYVFKLGLCDRRELLQHALFNRCPSLSTRAEYGGTAGNVVGSAGMTASVPMPPAESRNVPAAVSRTGSVGSPKIITPKVKDYSSYTRYAFCC